MQKQSPLDTSIRERRLRPIYDLLDSCNNKRVVQEVDRLLKKQPNFTCAKVLKGLALLRMNKTQECLSIVSPIVEELEHTLAEENTLQALSVCYRELEQPEMVCQIYENACKFEKSEDLLTHCFMAYARVGNFQSQYQTAMTLYKLYKKLPYFCWAIMSLVVKSVYEVDPASTKVSLTLAERMMAKFIEENDQEISLFILVLRKQRNYAKLLEILENTVRPTISTITGLYHQLKIECLQQTRQLEVLARYLENTILGSPNEWQYYSEYISLVDVIGEIRVEAFLLKVLDLYRSEVPPKSTLLAFPYLYNTLSTSNRSPKSELLAPMELYIKHYGHKASCFMDIEPFLSSLSSDDFKKYILSPPARCSIDSTNMDDLRRAVNYLYFSRFHLHGDAVDVCNSVETCQHLVLRYLDIKSKLGNLKPSEFSGHTDLIVLAALILVDSFWAKSEAWVGLYEKLYQSSKTNQLSNDSGENDNSGKAEINSISNGLESTHISNASRGQVLEEDFPVLICCAILSYALHCDPSNAQIRILLSKIYIRFGAIGAAIQVLKKLDLKYIQYESMGYLYIWKLAQSGFLQDGLRTLQSVENFYSSFQKESMEYVLSAYKYGAWENILEFNEFRKTLLNSIQLYLIRVEKTLLEYCKDAVSRTQTLQILQKGTFNISSVPWTSLTDGRDLTALNTFKPNPKLNEWKDKTMEAEKFRLKVRGLVLLLINDAVHIMDPCFDEDSLPTTIESMVGNIKELECEINKDSSKFELTDISVEGMWPPRISKYIASGYLQPLVKFFCLIFITVKDPTGESANEVAESLNDFFSVKIMSEIATFEPTKRPLFKVSDFIHNLFDITETLGLMCVLMDVLSSILKKELNLQEKSKKKKGKTVVDVSNHCQYFNNLHSSLKLCYESLNKQIDRAVTSLNTEYSSNWDDASSFWEGKVRHELVHILSLTLPDVLAMTHESYLKSLNEISYNVKSKIKYLNSMNAQNVSQ